MRLCVGTSKGIVILDPSRRGAPVAISAEPPSIWCMAQDSGDPNVIYAGATEFADNRRGRGRNSLARSNDGGRTWVDISANLGADEGVWSLAAAPGAPGELFAGTSHARIFRGTSHGRSFHECTAFAKMPGREHWSFPPPPHIPHVRSISFDPNDPMTMYAGVEEGGVFRSRDRGESFESLNKGIYTDIHRVAADPRNSRRLYATTGGGFYLSENAGEAWRHITDGLSRQYTVPLIAGAGTGEAVYTAAADGPPPSWSRGSAGADALFFRSDDHGHSFTAMALDGVSARGMVMQFRGDPDNGGFFGVMNDGTVIHASGADLTVIADKLPPAYDLVAIP
ncbi:MAG: WD40/YVTN/BNR-like repeat-containing protein [Candidatus Binataceae bacterium]